MKWSGSRSRVEFAALGIFLVALSCAAVIDLRPAKGEEGNARPGLSPAENRARTVLDVAALGRDLLQKKEYRRAAIEFEKVLQIDPSNSAAAECLKLCEERLEMQ
jgi:Tfp pilus assembly protein PilF